jgi:uncharacterized protein
VGVAYSEVKLIVIELVPNISWRKSTVLKYTACVAVFVCLTPALSHAAEPDADAGTGFFDYLPAAPELKLPKIDIPFWTDDLKIARRAYNRGNYDRALKYFRLESEDGNVVADWYLAHMYRLGQGVPQDSSVAFSYYNRVAESYDADEIDKKRLRIVVDSQVHLANYRRSGISTSRLKPDPEGAMRIYLRIASTYGHPAAQYALGEMNMLGEGVKANPQQGLKWLTAAARKRHPDAQAYLGDLYWSGRSVKKSETRALMWYILAMETTKPEEHPNIVNRYNELVSIVDGDTRLEAEARARVWSEQFPISITN